jgi:hypothetical protein
MILTEKNPMILTEKKSDDEEGDDLNQGVSLACVRETVEGDDDETTDSKGDDGRKDAFEKSKQLASEFSLAVRELRAESRGKAFDIPRLAGRKQFTQTPDSDISEGDESEST